MLYFQGLIDATSSESSLDDEAGVRMVALFDHEEVGSSSAQGAGSPAMFTALSRITNSFTADPQVVNGLCSIIPRFLSISFSALSCIYFFSGTKGNLLNDVKLMFT